MEANGGPSSSEVASDDEGPSTSGAATRANPSTSGLSAYELQRQENMQRNREQLIALGIEPLSTAPQRQTAQKRPRKPCMPADLGPKRKSPRVQDSHGSKRPVYNEKQAYKLLLGDSRLRKERQVSDTAAGSQSDEDSDEDSDDVEDSDSGSDLSKELSEASGEEDGDDDEGDEVDEPRGVRAADEEDEGEEVEPVLAVPSGVLHAKVGLGGMVEEACGLRLHLSRRSTTGYKGVVYIPEYRGTGTPMSKPYLVIGPRHERIVGGGGSSHNNRVYLGSYKTAVEGAVAFAQYVARGRARPAAHDLVSEAYGVKLHLSHRSSSGYEGVREHLPYEGYVGVARYRAVAPMRGGKMGPTIGYFATALEAAVAFAKFVQSPRAFEDWKALRATEASQPLPTACAIALPSLLFGHGDEHGGGGNDDERGAGGEHSGDGEHRYGGVGAAPQLPLQLRPGGDATRDADADFAKPMAAESSADAASGAAIGAAPRESQQGAAPTIVAERTVQGVVEYRVGRSTAEDKWLASEVAAEAAEAAAEPLTNPGVDAAGVDAELMRTWAELMRTWAAARRDGRTRVLGAVEVLEGLGRARLAACLGVAYVVATPVAAEPPHAHRSPRVPGRSGARHADSVCAVSSGTGGGGELIAMGAVMGASSGGAGAGTIACSGCGANAASHEEGGASCFGASERLIQQQRQRVLEEARLGHEDKLTRHAVEACVNRMIRALERLEARQAGLAAPPRPAVPRALPALDTDAPHRSHGRGSHGGGSHGSGRGAGSKRARASLESSVAEAHWSLRGALHGASGFPLTDADGGAGGSSGSGAAAAPADASDAAAHGAVASAERRERRPKRLNFSRPCPRCGEENHVRRLECEVCGLVLKEPVSKRRAAAAAEAALEAALCYARYVGAERAPAEPGKDGDQGEEAAAGNDENFVSMVHHRAEMDKLEHKFKAELQKQVRKVESRFEGKLQAIERRFERRLERHLGVRALEDPDDEQSDAEGDGVSDSSERDKEEEHVVEEEQPSCSSTPPKRQRLAAL